MHAVATTDPPPPLPWGGSTPYSGLYEEAPAEMGTFLRLKVYERVRISLVGVYERVQKSVISFCKSALNQLLTEEFYGFKKPRKRSGFVFIHI